MLLIITCVFIIPTNLRAQTGSKEKLLEKFNIASIEKQDVEETDGSISAILNITMLDGKEFSIPVLIDKRELKITFEFASGKTVILSASRINETWSQGYQEYDDVENTVLFTDAVSPFGTTECILSIVGYLITPFPLDLIFVYLIYISCF